MKTEDELKTTLNQNIWENNLYYQKNQKLFMMLISYVKKYPISCCKVLSRKYRLRHLPQNSEIIDLMPWIIQVTS